MMMTQASRGMKGRRIRRQAVTSRIVRPMWMDASSARLTWVLSYSGLRNVMVESSCFLKLTLGPVLFTALACRLLSFRRFHQLIHRPSNIGFDGPRQLVLAGRRGSNSDKPGTISFTRICMRGMMLRAIQFALYRGLHRTASFMAQNHEKWSV